MKKVQCYDGMCPRCALAGLLAALSRSQVRDDRSAQACGRPAMLSVNVRRRVRGVGGIVPARRSPPGGVFHSALLVAGPRALALSRS